MNAFLHLARTLAVLSGLSIAFAMLHSADASAAQLVGPRNTIERTSSSSSSPRSIAGMQASRDEAARCRVVHIVHYGHPGKGVNRLEKVDIACGAMRLSVR